MAARNYYTLYLPGGIPFDLRILLVPVVVGVFAVFCFADLRFISPTIAADSSVMLDELWLMTKGAEASSSYYYSALIFQSLPEGLLLPAVALVGIAHILILYGRNSHPVTLLLCTVLLLPALLFFARPAKETLLSPVTFLVLGLLCLRLNGLLRVLAVAACYLFYAYFMREYFVVILAAFAGLMILLPLSWGLRLALLAGALAALSLAPSELFQLLQGPRDAVNLLRMATSVVGVQSAFNNPLPPDGLGNFLLNYGYAFARLNLPVLFQLRMQEVFLLSVVLATFTLIAFGLRRGGPKERACALLVLAHALTLNLFEPDLGSYLRHLTSATIYLAPVLSLLDRHLAAPETQAEAGALAETQAAAQAAAQADAGAQAGARGDAPADDGFSRA